MPRTTILAALLLGILSMHGFVATVPDGQHEPLLPHVMAVVDLAVVDGAGHEPAAPTGGSGPASHDDMLLGCLVALVGIAVVAAAVRTWAPGIPLRSLGILARPVPANLLVRDRYGTQPRIALCVLRV